MPLRRDRRVDIVSEEEGGQLGAVVRFHRRRLLWTQVDLATASGVSARTISDLERGVHSSARLSTIARLAEAMELNGVEVQRMMSLAQRVDRRADRDTVPRVGADADLGGRAQARSEIAQVAAAAGDWVVAADDQAAFVDALELSDDIDRGLMCDAYLELGRAATLAMRRQDARPAYMRAARLAMSVGDRHRLVRSAAGYAFMTKAGEAGQSDEATWRTAQRWIDDRDLAARSIIAAACACAMVLAERGDPAAELAEHSLALARRCDDPDALAVAISVVLLATRGWPNAQRRLELADEMASLGETTLDHVDLAGVESLAVPSLELGDRESFSRCVQLLRDRGTAAGHPFALAQARVWEATLALLDGDVAAAAQYSTEGLALSGGAPNFSDGHVAQQFSILRMQGRAAELYDGLRAYVAGDPGEAAWRAAYLTTAAAAGDDDTTVVGLERVRTEMWPLPRTRTYPVTLALLAEAAFQVDDPLTAGIVAEELRPYAGTFVVVATATGCEGPVDHYRAMAASASGDGSGAAALARRAVRQAERLGAEPLTRRSEALLAALA